MTADQPASVTALIIPPDRPAYTAVIQPTLPVLHDLVGGHLEGVSRGGWHAYLNETGKLLRLPPNQAATGLLFPAGGDVVAGVAVVLGDGPGGGEADVPPEVAARVLADHPTARLRTTAEVLAAVPVLLGFVPSESLVVVSVAADGRVQSAARFNLAGLADPAHIRTGAAFIARWAPDWVTLVVVGAGTVDPDRALPAEHVVTALTGELAGYHIPVRHPHWIPALAAGAEWACYEDPDCTGQLPDPATTELGAAATAAGMVTHGSWDGLAAELAADTEDVLARRAAQLAAQVHVTDGIGLLRRAVADADRGVLPDRDEQIVALAAALLDHPVRDYALRLSAGKQPAAAERLWTVLTRAAPAPHRTVPATLAALVAYLRGDGVRAGVAIRIARQADPGYQMALLVQTVLNGGMDPDVVRTVLTRPDDQS